MKSLYGPRKTIPSSTQNSISWDFDYDYDHETVIIQIRTQAMEKLRQKPRIDMETLNYQSTKERKIVEQEGMEFCSVGSSSFSECCPSDLSIEGYITAKVFKVFELERYRAGESMTNVLFE
ncbi:BnaC08g04480D [Brassica napus]|uniref:BnaC08g04480D protein n=2 Tax=Brassica TaxID=3705 RepID=A0A078FXD2_BRANA|nr:BnaC08g04480D [Brassica napus]VDD54247.1 unnamed protein product [Brassica oleracea]